jgi:hypothetical protein
MGFSTKSVLCQRADVEFLSAGNCIYLQPDQDFSLVVWFKTSYTSDLRHLVARTYYSSGVPKGYALSMLATGEIQLDLVNTQFTNHLSVKTTTTWADGDWHCVILTHDTALGGGTAAAVKLYVDNTLQTLTTNYDTLTSNLPEWGSNFCVGVSQGDWNRTWDGYIDSVAIYRGKVLDTSEIGWIYNVGITQNLKHANAPSGLTHWWRMGETITGDGEIADEAFSDYSPLSQSLDLNNDTVNEGVSFPHVSALDKGKDDAFSGGIWVKYTGGGDMTFMSKYSWPAPAYAGWRLYDPNFPAGSTAIQLRAGLSDLISVVDTLAGVNDGNWHLISFTYGGGNTVDNLRIYKDGQLRVTGSGGSSLTGSMNNTSPLWAGRLDGGGFGPEYYVGKACHSFFYDRELSQPEMAQIYNNGVPPDLSATGMPSGLVHWCTLGDGCSTGAGNCPDLSATNNDGSTSNVESTDFVSDAPAPGYVPLTQSIELNNGSSDEYVDFGTVPQADFVDADACTFGVWIKHDQQDFVPSINEQQWIFAKHQTGGGDISFAVLMHVSQSAPLQPQYNLYGIYGSGIVKSAARYSYAATRWPTWDGVWHLVVFRRASGGANAEVWVDNVRYSESLTTFQPNPGMDADGTFTVGAYKSSGNPQGPVYGNVCHAFIYDKQLTFAEMKAIYAEGVPQDLSVVGPTGNLVFWSGMGDGDAIGAGNVLDKSGNANHGTLVNGESGDFVPVVPAADYSLTLKGRIQIWPAGATVANEAPVGNEYSTYYEDPGNIPLHTWQQDTFPQYTFDSYHEDPGNVPLHTWQATTEYEPILWYRMRGIDTTCPAIQQPAYVFWTVANTPDWVAAHLSAGELICGTDPSTDVDDIAIAGEWVEEPP